MNKLFKRFLLGIITIMLGFSYGQTIDLKITILSTMVADYDYLGEWGFSAIIESDGHKLLFDTGVALYIEVLCSSRSWAGRRDFAAPLNVDRGRTQMVQAKTHLYFEHSQISVSFNIEGARKNWTDGNKWILEN